MEINREDMLELTRRMTLKRNCFTRIAGAYVDEDGFEDGTFNVHFLKLSPAHQSNYLKIAKTVPFADTNRQLRLFPFGGQSEISRQTKQCLTELVRCGLKDDGLLSILYEVISEAWNPGKDYGIILLHGSYDVPLKAADHKRLWESEEVYDFVIGCICLLAGEYEPEIPEWGFLYPAFTDRSRDTGHIAVFEALPEQPHTELNQGVLGI